MAENAKRELTFPGPSRALAPATSAEVSARMSRTGRRDTKPELQLRQHLHRLGLRFRVDRPVLSDRRRRVDVVFGPAKVAVFVDGCFWHGCPLHATFPKKNAQYWREKIETNRARDLDTNDQLARAGWHVERAWEHEDMAAVADRVAAIVRDRRRALRPNEPRGPVP